MSSESRVPQFGKRYISFYLHACGLISVLSERSNELTKTSIARVTTTILKALTKQRSTLLRLKMTKRMNRVSLVVSIFISSRCNTKPRYCAVWTSDLGRDRFSFLQAVHKHPETHAGKEEWMYAEQEL
jgi:hypothetical protein